MRDDVLAGRRLLLLAGAAAGITRPPVQRVNLRKVGSFRFPGTGDCLPLDTLVPGGEPNYFPPTEFAAGAVAMPPTARLSQRETGPIATHRT